MTSQRLTPRFLEKVWGSTRLEPWFRDAGKKIGEVWFEGVADLPLLVKFLFTSDKLSVQVHPDDAFAREHEGSRGKTEMWHVLAAEPGAKIAAGFRESLSPERLREAALSGEIESLLEWFDAAPGDTFFIPAGTVHAIGGGLTLCEIQQNSDVTYRLYDYGRPRELHLDRALAVSHRDRHPARQRASGDVLVACDHFVTERIRVEGPTRLEAREGFQVLVGIEGWGAGEAWYLAPGAALDVPRKSTLLRSGVRRRKPARW
jgi:mannose-6-phosphate isomerase